MQRAAGLGMFYYFIFSRPVRNFVAFSYPIQIRPAPILIFVLTEKTHFQSITPPPVSISFAIMKKLGFNYADIKCDFKLALTGKKKTGEEPFAPLSTIHFLDFLEYILMFTSNGTREFCKKIRPYFGLLISTTKPFSSERIIKQKNPVKKTHQKNKKSPKLSVRKENVDRKVYMRDIIAKIYNVLKYSTWDSAQEQLENLSIKWDSYTVNQVLKTHPPMEKAWLFFNWASGRKNFKHDQYTYTTMLDIFGEARRISSMKYIFQQMQEKGIKVDVVTYTSLLHWMSNDGDVDGAVKLWEEMKLKGCHPTVVSYTAYMKILFESKRVKEATEVYKEMLQSGLSPNCYTYTVLMEHLACSGKFNEALEVFNKMQEAGVQPDKAACNILVEICCRTGETWAMMKILQYMKENFLVLRFPVYQKALETFKMAGESCEILMQVNRHLVIEHFKEEKTDNFGETASGNCSNVDNGFVLNLINKQNLVAVDYLLADMMDKGVRLDSKIISTIIELNSANGRWNSALFAFEYGAKFGLNMDRIAYIALIGLSIRTNSFSKVVEIVEEMVREGHSLGTQQSALLIYHLGCNRDPVSAAKIFSVLPDGEKNTATHTALIGAYFSSGNVNKGLETLQIMKSEGINVALGTYCVVVAGLEKCGRVSELEFYRKEKKRMQAESNLQAVSMEETLCNFLFSGDSVVRLTR